MEEIRIQRVHKALGLQRQIIGVRFLVFKKEYDLSNATTETKTSLCQMAADAGTGKCVKANAESLRCLDGAYATGILDIPEETASGRACNKTGRYESFAVARQIFESRQFIPQKIYGIELSPLISMEDADLAIIIGTAKDIMRVMQGYAKYYGAAANILTTGTYGICSELISKPLMNNDINISLLSRDARKNGGFSMQEMGASIPIHMLQHVLDGILETVNLTENNKPKQEILSRLDDPEELGFSIRMNYDYAIQGMEYEKYCQECLSEENQ